MTNYKEKCRPACVSCLLSEELYLGVFFAIRGWYELVPTQEHVEVKLAFVSKLSRLVNINWTARFYCLFIHFRNIKLGYNI